ncbi:dnaJ homolog subfamily C member 4-like isoform X2 [Oratosquilla oratoria]|uniref:dnaJ homolog subfamily C member 4-like isoform X2 n=1 Tax=Oratosquilla oratoria TaxID=337810 RepID=UPI003F758E64
MELQLELQDRTRLLKTRMQSKSLGATTKRLLISGQAWQRWQTLRALSQSRDAKKVNYYEVLGVEKDCCQTEIKKAFFELSKEFHPDKNLGDPEQHRRFIALNEAYSVLSKPQTRRLYDVELHRWNSSVLHHSTGGVMTNAPRERVVFHDESIWEMRDKSKDGMYADRPYYGVPGVKKLPNSYIAGGAILFMVFGIIVHYFVIKKTSDMAIEQLNLRDEIASKNYMIARERANSHTLQEQMQLLRERAAASCPTK